MLIISSRTVTPIAIGHGLRCTKWLQRYDQVSRSDFSGRGGNSLPRPGTKNDMTSVASDMAAKAAAAGWNPRPTASSATAMKPAMIKPRQRVTSTRGPAKPMSAGRSVSEATIVMATVTAAPVASPLMNASCITNMPSSEMTTVRPAKSTARPAVSIARTVASCDDIPARVPSRYRVTMKRA